jgi:hypothetical protein
VVFDGLFDLVKNQGRFFLTESSLPRLGQGRLM